MKKVLFALTILLMSHSVFADNISADTLDSYLGSYKADTGTLSYGLFFKETALLSDTGTRVARYILFRSAQPMTSIDQAKSSNNAVDFYVDETGAFFQFYNAGAYKTPYPVAELDQHVSRTGTSCEWQPATKVDDTSVNMNYCGKSESDLSFGDGTIQLVQKTGTNTTSDQTYTLQDQ